MAKINIQCYKCETIYELEPDMIGETVECAVCGTVFVIPDFDPDAESEIIETNSHINPQQEAAPTAKQAPSEEPQSPAAQETAPAKEEEFEPPPVYTNKKLASSTIKLDIDRKGHGMVPVIDDQFGLKKSHNPRRQEEKKEEAPPVEADSEDPDGK